MLPQSRRTVRRLAPLVLLAAAACDAGSPDAEVRRATDSRAAPRPEYVREYVFLGAREGQPLIVPFAFRARDAGSEVARVSRGWLAVGARWEAFLEDRWSSPRPSGVWRVLPRGDLRIAASGPNEVGSLWYQRGERRLRLELGAPLSGWQQGEDARFRVNQARLTLGDEVMVGAALQLLEVDRRGGGRNGSAPADWIFLASGDSLRMVLARVGGARDRFGTSFGWAGRADGDRSWEMVEIDFVELRPLQQARRDIPLRWRFRVPGAGVQGQIRALGYETVVGQERAGRREVEVRYTVEGWVEIDGRTSRVEGTVRHSQR